MGNSHFSPIDSLLGKELGDLLAELSSNPTVSAATQLSDTLSFGHALFQRR